MLEEPQWKADGYVSELEAKLAEVTECRKQLQEDKDHLEAKFSEAATTTHEWKKAYDEVTGELEALKGFVSRSPSQDLPRSAVQEGLREQQSQEASAQEGINLQDI